MVGQVLRHDGLLHEIVEGRMRGKPTRGRRRIKCYMIWQMMVAILLSNGQLRTETGRQRKNVKNSAVSQKTTDDDNPN